MRFILAVLSVVLLAGCGAAPAAVATPTGVPLPPPLGSALARQLAGQLAAECSGMTADQIVAAAVANARAQGNTTPERILAVAVGSPALVQSAGTCAAAVRSAAVYDHVYGP